MHLMYGTEPRQHFDRFNIDVNCIVGKILAKVKVDVMKLSPVDGRKLEDVKLEDILPKCGEYFINCCLMPAIKKLSALEVKSDKEKMLIEILSQRGLDLTDIDRYFCVDCIKSVGAEIRIVEEHVPGLSLLAAEASMNKPYFVIKHRVLRQFWVENIHPRLNISTKNFLVLIQNYLSAHGKSSGQSIDLANSFRDAIFSDHDESDNIDAFSMEKAGRMHNCQDYEFVDVINVIASNFNRTKIIQNLPIINSTEEVSFSSCVVNHQITNNLRRFFTIPTKKL